MDRAGPTCLLSVTRVWSRHTVAKGLGVRQPGKPGGKLVGGQERGGPAVISTTGNTRQSVPQRSALRGVLRLQRREHRSTVRRESQGRRMDLWGWQEGEGASWPWLRVAGGAHRGDASECLAGLGPDPRPVRDGRPAFLLWPAGPVALTPRPLPGRAQVSTRTSARMGSVDVHPGVLTARRLSAQPSGVPPRMPSL